jgi:hypothetical protein
VTLIQLDAVGVVDQTIEYAVCDSRIADLLVPLGNGKLAGQDSRSTLIAFLTDLQEVASFGLAHWVHRPVVDYQHIGTSNLAKQP